MASGNDPSSCDPGTSRRAVPVDRPAGTVVPLTLRPHHLPHAPAPGGAFTVDCADCAHRLTDVCADCVVSFIVGREPEDAVVVDAAEARAVRLLERAGMLPAMRHESRASGQ